MLDQYTGAFARYMRSGTVGALCDFCAADADLARLRVYRNGFLRACSEALRTNYPAVERLVGEERFPALARPYVEAHPPRVATLVEYGDGFARYLDDTRNMHGLDYLASFATLDRAWTEVFFSEDDARESAPRRSDPSEVPASAVAHRPLCAKPKPASGRFSPEVAEPPAAAAAGNAEAMLNLCGRLSPWVRLVSLDCCVLDVWSRLRQDNLAQQSEIRQTPQRVLIWRSGADMLYRALTPPEHTFISGVAAGRSCGDAAGAALDTDAGFDLAATFASLLHHHMLSFEH